MLNASPSAPLFARNAHELARPALGLLNASPSAPLFARNARELARSALGLLNASPSALLFARYARELARSALGFQNRNSYAQMRFKKQMLHFRNSIPLDGAEKSLFSKCRENAPKWALSSKKQPLVAEMKTRMYGATGSFFAIIWS